MILHIFLLFLFLLLLILLTFFTLYFLIPLVNNNKKAEDPIVPKPNAPDPLPRQRNITPYETSVFVKKLIQPVSIEEKINLLNGNNEDNEQKTEENILINNNNKSKKDFKIWEFCYKMIERFR